VKNLRFLAIFLAIVAVLIISIPASANSTQTYVIQGIEISPGIDIGNYNIGATFVAQATNSDYCGTMSTSVNYTPNAPVRYGTNIFVGGNWSLTVKQDGIVKGYVSGRIPFKGGSISWSNDGDSGGPNNGTEIGTVSTSLTVTIGTGIFWGITGGTFVGADDHVTGIFIAGIEVPTIAGTLTLYH
jgi:hypothetical protein